MRKTAIVVAATAAAFCAQPAAAQSNPFNGFHVGVNVGAGVADLKYTQAPYSADLAAPGIVGGASVGYMYAFGGGWFVDVEALFDYSAGKADFNLGRAGSIKQGIGYGGAASIGYMIGPATAVYGKGGYMSSSFDLGNGGKQDGGWLLGLGLRHALTENWSIKGEYNYVGYSKITEQVSGATVEPMSSMFRVGADYRF